MLENVFLGTLIRKQRTIYVTFTRLKATYHICYIHEIESRHIGQRSDWFTVLSEQYLENNPRPVSCLCKSYLRINLTTYSRISAFENYFHVQTVTSAHTALHVTDPLSVQLVLITSILPV